MKRIFILISILGMFLLGATVQAVTVEEIQERASRDCANYRPQISSIVSTLERRGALPSLTWYQEELKKDLTEKFTIIKTHIDEWCATMQKGDFEEPVTTTAQTVYDQSADFHFADLVIPLYRAVIALDQYYLTYDGLKKIYDDPSGNGGILKDKNDFAEIVNPDIIRPGTHEKMYVAVEKTHEHLSRADQTIATPRDVMSVFAQPVPGAFTALQTLTEKIRTAQRELSLGKTQAMQAKRLLTEIMTYAAYEDVSPDGKSPSYDTLYREIRAKVDREIQSGIADTEKTRATVARVRTEVTAAPLLDATTKERALTFLTVVDDWMIQVKAFFVTPQARKYYTKAKPLLDGIEEADIDMPLGSIRLLKTVQKQLSIIHGATTELSAEETGLADIVSGMRHQEKKAVLRTVLGEEALRPLEEHLERINLGSLDRQYEEIETKISAVISVPLDAPLQERRQAHADFKKSVAQLKKSVAAERKKVTQAQKIWFELIRQAAASGRIERPEVFEGDLKISKMIDGFNKNRESLYKKVDTIVESRKKIIDTLEEKITGEELDAYTEKAKEDLETFARIARETKDYFELKEKVKDFKLYGINEIFVPGQKLYLHAETLQKKINVYQQVAGVLEEKINDVTDAEKKTTLSEKLNDVKAAFTKAETDLTHTIEETLRDALNIRETAPAPDASTRAEEALDRSITELRTIQKNVKLAARSLREVYQGLQNELKAQAAEQENEAGGEEDAS